MVSFFQIENTFFKKSFLLYALFVIVIFYFLAAVISDGWLNNDEHFQILEFANYKRGLLEKKYLAWEFTDRLRPALQPMIAYILLNTMSFAGLKNPFDQAILLRLFSSCLFLFSSYFLFSSLRKRFANPFYQYFYFLSTFFLYCFPLFGVRFFSENWSACFLIIAIATFCKYEKGSNKMVLTNNSQLLTGMLLGLSFLFRYQSAIMIFGLSLWLLIFYFKSIKRWIMIFVGFLIVCFVGILIDRWFYGEWVLSSWNYFYINLIENKAASFGTAPWWWYFEQLLVGRWLSVLNIVLIILVGVFGIRNYKHPFTWLFFPFLFVHMLISHKEIRFIYPIMVFVPFMIVDSFLFIEGFFKKNILYSVIVLLAIINFFGFVANSFRVHDNSSQIFKFIGALPYKPIVIYTQGEFFYYTLANDVKSLSPRFYRKNHTILRRELTEKSVELESKRLMNGDTLVYFVFNSFDEKLNNTRLKTVYSAQPLWLSKLNYRNWMHKSFGDWKVYEIDGSNEIRK
ncbi:hypothetical protein [Dyadobacter sp. 3J3]|uniref:hypothetical protein n=1 Tax=Dyadobacter sp. 3J3 TaxID=2606600 RepID=UPI0013597D8E|nr:hypothetical protein [Dyadobacter sp. 3J3]